MTEAQRKLYEALKDLNTVIFISPEYDRVRDAAVELELEMKRCTAPYATGIFPPSISDMIDKPAIEITGRIWDRLQYDEPRRRQKHTRIRGALGYTKPEER